MAPMDIYGYNVDFLLLYGTHMDSIWVLRGTTVQLFKYNIKQEVRGPQRSPELTAVS